MNILIAADYATPNSGNFVASCVELGRRLKKMKYRLSIIVPENNNTLRKGSWTDWLRAEGISVYLFRKGESDELSFLKDVIKKDAIDVLHIHFELFLHSSRKYTKELGVKILVHDHMDFPAGRSLLKSKMICAVRSIEYRMSGMSLICVNPYKTKAYIFAQRWYVPNGLSFIRNVRKSVTREECREEIGIAQGEKICLFLGWDCYRKGLDIAVKAIDEINRKDCKVLLCIVGLGNPPGNEGINFIEDKTGIDANSSWIKYLPAREDVFAYHRAADVYLSASRSEAFSYGILEALSQNIPIAVSGIKGTDWCHEYSKAIVYSTEDSHACAQAVKKALQITNEKSNANEIVKKYSIEKWCRKMIHIYESL